MQTFNNVCVHRNDFIELRLRIGILKILHATPLPSLMCVCYPYGSQGASAVHARACGSATASCGGY